MSGIYIHIPFCIQRCHYCDFYSVTNLNLVEHFIQACIHEIEDRADEFIDYKADTIYFGGGTPSSLEIQNVDQLIKTIRRKFEISESAEITLEANPDDIHEEKLLNWRKIGINRLSIGTQSFHDVHLKLMNRRHNAVQALNAVRMAEKAGFDNIGIDLIYGLPGLTIEDWKYNLSVIKDLPVNHLSSYHLTIESGTVFDTWKKNGKIELISDEESFEQYLLLKKYTSEMGFEHYEVSNFAKNGNYSRHNIKYWRGKPYLGFGPSAHSFINGVREWNPSSIKEYVEQLQNGNFRRESEVIDLKTERNEQIMTGFRTIWGIQKHEWKKHGFQTWDQFIEQCSRYIDSGDIVYSNERLFIDTDAWFRADGIIADLFIL